MNAALLIYYAATALFLLLDLALDLNVRVAFLDNYPAARFGYYGVCFFCLGLIIWRPSWAVLVGAFESLIVLVALIVSMGVRVLVVTDEMIESGSGFVTGAEIVNFALAGAVAYIAWARGMHALQEKYRL